MFNTIKDSVTKMFFIRLRVIANIGRKKILENHIADVTLTIVVFFNLELLLKSVNSSFILRSMFASSLRES